MSNAGIPLGLVLGVLVLMIFAVCFFIVLRDKASNVKSPEEKAFLSKPVRVYKLAYLEPGPVFRGVSGGGRYSVDSKAEPDSPGFHGFYSYTRARQLLDTYYENSAGLVILECVLYGNVSSAEVGAIGSHQKVLQVILPDCPSCKKPSSGVYFYEDYGYARNTIPCSVLASLKASNRYSISAFNLAEQFADDGVVVSTEQGPHKFIPTVDDRLRTTWNFEAQKSISQLDKIVTA